MKESNFQVEFSKRNLIEGVFELKLCKGKSLSFSSVAEHQEKALLAASSKQGLFTRPKPFDCFYLKNYPAYIVIMWWIPYKKKNAYYIDINTWLELKENAGRKSITEAMAQEFSSHTESYFK